MFGLFNVGCFQIRREMKNLNKIILMFVLSFGVMNFVQAREYTFSVVPRVAPKKLVKMWRPFIKELSRSTGLKFKFVTTKDIPTFEKELANGAYDFAFMSPFHYIMASKNSGYRAFAHEDKKLVGVLVALKDSKLTGLKDLAGKTLAFPAPNAFAASLIIRAELIKQAIPFTPKYVKSHDNVYKTVSTGYFLAGGGVGKTFKNTNKVVRSKLKVLWTTPGYVPHAFASHKNVPADVLAKVKAAFVKMQSTAKGKGAIKSAKLKPLVPSNDKEYDMIRNLNLESIAK